MSWAGFKKNVNRATTQVMMKTGHVERTSDRDYEVEERYVSRNVAGNLTDAMQPVPDDGGCGDEVAEGGQRIFGQSTR